MIYPGTVRRHRIPRPVGPAGDMKPMAKNQSSRASAPKSRKSALDLALLAVALAGGSVLAAAPAAAADTPPTLREALEIALDDEWKAEAAYSAIIARLGPVRPFVRIVDAERRHAQSLITLISINGWPLPNNPWPGTMTSPATLAEACQAGVAGEIANIALYDRLIAAVTDPAAIRVFTSLQTASRDSHLPAFTRCAG